MEHYQVSLGVTLSKNYNSVKGEVTFGRDAKSGETRNQLVEDVNNEVRARLDEVAIYANELLTEAAKRKKA